MRGKPMGKPNKIKIKFVSPPVHQGALMQPHKHTRSFTHKTRMTSTVKLRECDALQISSHLFNNRQ